MAVASISSAVIRGVEESCSEAVGTSGEFWHDPRLGATDSCVESWICGCGGGTSLALPGPAPVWMPARVGLMSSFKKNEASKPPKSFSAVSGRGRGTDEADKPVEICVSGWAMYLHTKCADRRKGREEALS
jgi:hypothetical protein